MTKKQNNHLNFTKKALAKLTCPSDKKQVYYKDSQVRGLYISVARGGSKSFVLRRKVNGKSERILLGPFPDLTIEQARRLAYEKHVEISSGVNPAEIRRGKKNEPTLNDLFTEYINRHAKEKRKTSSDMEKNYNRYLFEYGEMNASNITAEEVELLHRKLGKERGHHTANRTIQLLRSIFNKAIAWKITTQENPASGVSLYPEKPRDRFLSIEEATILLRELEKIENNDLRDFIKLSYFTGIRKSNLFSLRWDYIDWKSGTLTLPETKNATSQKISLSKIEILILKKRVQDQKKKAKKQKSTPSAFVFPGKGKDGHLKDLKRSWSTFRKRIGMHDVTIHDLRRSLGATMANANTNVSIIKSALNHKDMKTTIAVYAQTQQETVRDAREHALKPILIEAGLLSDE